jgi:hypothetical protein
VSRPSSALLFLLLCALGCGKYGPPVRAGAEEAPAHPPSFEVPLPPVPEQAPEAAPAVPEAEEEPPPEGTP